MTWTIQMLCGFLIFTKISSYELPMDSSDLLDSVNSQPMISQYTLSMPRQKLGIKSSTESKVQPIIVINTGGGRKSKSHSYIPHDSDIFQQDNEHRSVRYPITAYVPTEYVYDGSGDDDDDSDDSDHDDEDEDINPSSKSEPRKSRKKNKNSFKWIASGNSNGRNSHSLMPPLPPSPPPPPALAGKSRLQVSNRDCIGEDCERGHRKKLTIVWLGYE
ncbi:uncharacterized protein LOC141855198 [Brevipalpus obovatus]|uniref:uncharacterized protein LOC141855198 n=1 Tax=Brevipalpus obovatus TaxID=246614 RepID=UPI003D9FA03C